jgi:chemotaxis response regulator CheB
LRPKFNFAAMAPETGSPGTSPAALLAFHGQERPWPPRKRPQLREPASPARPSGKFSIVCIGASAGGLEAFSKLLEHLPATTGMGYVIIQHLDPTHPSALPPLLGKKSSLRSSRRRTGLASNPTTCTSSLPIPS